MMQDYDLNIWNELAHETDGVIFDTVWRVDVYPEDENGTRGTEEIARVTITQKERESLDESIGKWSEDVDTWLYLSGAPKWLRERVKNELQ